MARLRQVSRSDADPNRVIPVYDVVLGDRDDPIVEVDAPDDVDAAALATDGRRSDRP